MSTNGPTDKDVQMNEATITSAASNSNSSAQLNGVAPETAFGSFDTLAEQSLNTQNQGFTNKIVQGVSSITQTIENNKLLTAAVAVSTGLGGWYGHIASMTQATAILAPMAYITAGGVLSGAITAGVCVGGNKVYNSLKKGKKRKADEAELDVVQTGSDQPNHGQLEQPAKAPTPAQPA
ncbi:MAG: hypothetical protein JSS07_01870, partial [Proteobacteria bacterium]|nr:hypothetical protein [Pseudomonadota bacterium]